MYAATGGPNVKWGGTDFKWGGQWYPLATALGTVYVNLATHSGWLFVYLLFGHHQFTELR